MVDEALVRHYLPLVRSNLRYVRGSGISEDLFQEGVLGILEALQMPHASRADQDLAVRRAIGRRIMQAYRVEKRHRQRELHPESTLEVEPLETMLAATDDPEDVVQRLWFDWVMTHLRGRQRQCASLYFGEGLTQAEIAQRLGMRQQCVSQSILGGLRHLRVLFQSGEAGHV